MSLLTTTTLTISGAAEEGSGGAWDSGSLATAAAQLVPGVPGGVNYSDPVGQASKLLVISFADPGLDRNHTILGLTVDARSNSSLPEPRPADSLVRFRIGASGGPLSQDKATGTEWLATTNRSWGSASDCWTGGGASDFGAALVPGSLGGSGGLKFLLRMTSSQPSLFVLDSLAVTVTSVRCALVDISVLERLVAARLESALSSSLVTLRHIGEEIPVQSVAGVLPWMHFVGATEVKFQPLPRTAGVTGDTHSPDQVNVSFGVVVGVPDGATRTRGYAMGTAMSLIRMALQDVELSDDSTGHTLRLLDMSLTRDPFLDEESRAVTCQVRIEGWACRTSGGTFEGT